MFGKKNRNAAASPIVGKFLTEFVDTHIATERMKEAARSSERIAAVLKPQIPIGEGEVVGWFGGHPQLPEGMRWPEGDGGKLLFAGQINLSAVPRSLWSGAGPRAGWLGVFLPVKWPPKPTVVHFDGPLAEVKGPPHCNADWTRNHNFEKFKTFHLPRWPLTLSTIGGHALHLEEGAAQDANTSGPACLLDPAYHPFDRETVTLLLDALSEVVAARAKEIIRFPAMKKLRSEDAAWFERQRPIALQTFQRFFELEGPLRGGQALGPEPIAKAIAEFATLRTYDYVYRRNDGGGFCELDLRETHLLDDQPKTSGLRQWWTAYEAGLKVRAAQAYVTEPNQLPDALRHRMEELWRKETKDGLGAMGHAPRGHIYTPHGPDTENEVLLEIFTSNVAGWIWADCYSLVLLIEREALRRGDFSSVAFDITN